MNLAVEGIKRIVDIEMEIIPGDRQKVGEDRI